MWLAGLLVVAKVAAHGGVSIEEDTCIMQIGPYKAHFTGYQPAVRASQEFCEDIPAVASAIIVLDFIDLPLRDMSIDFRVVADVKAIGVTATYEDLGSPADIKAATVLFEAPAVYPRGNLNVELEFEQAGDFIGVVTAADAATGRQYTSVFPFSVGKSRAWQGFGWILGTIGFGAALYFLNRKAPSPRAGAADAS